jgi:DNA-binding HxlR family transcriptional regulator
MAQIINFREDALQSLDVIDLVSNKWRITILHLLRNGPLRTRALQAAIPEISPKVLTESLRGMERDGLISRRVHAIVPLRVEYSLTAMGASLLDPLADLCHWAKAHVQERDAARSRFDLAQSLSQTPRRSKSARR